jgi:hypothetical protein
MGWLDPRIDRTVNPIQEWIAEYVRSVKTRCAGADRQLRRMTGMTNLEDRPPPAIGVYWISEGDYPALLKIFADGNKLPRSWNEWLKTAEEMEQGLKAYGHVVMRVHIDPGTFPDWCAAHGTSPGREGRKKFVAAAVTERYGDQN